MNVNYQTQLDGILADFTGRGGARPRLLLHSCCGPCSSYVISYLSAYFDIGLLFYNPNINTRAEYDKRLETQARLLAALPAAEGVRLIETGWRPEDFTTETVRRFADEPEGGARCTECFTLRLGETAKLAAAEGYGYFCTTLTVSPHKDAARINAIGAELGGSHGVSWLPSDFKKRGGYLRSIELSKEYGLYRQAYCGCKFSKND